MKKLIGFKVQVWALEPSDTDNYGVEFGHYIEVDNLYSSVGLSGLWGFDGTKWIAKLWEGNIFDCLDKTKTKSSEFNTEQEAIEWLFATLGLEWVATELYVKL